MRSNDSYGPFSDYSAPFWESLNISAISDEHVVSKLHLLDNLEVSSPYRGTSVPVWRRIWKSLDCLDRFDDVRQEWKHAALFLFANTVYLPQVLLNDAWRALYLELCEAELDCDSVGARQRILDSIHIFENDPSAMTGTFCHVNGLEGRLDNQRLQRVEGVDKLADVLLDLLNPVKRDRAESILVPLFTKPHWVILVDKSLSGHSLEADLRRLVIARSIAEKAGFNPPKIVVLCQVLTSKAVAVIQALVEDLPDGAFSWYCAVLFDDRHSITHPDSTLISDPAIRESALELCHWFSARFLESDKRLARMRERSGDNLEFGYRACGLTLVDYSNCPTDSLPIFWYATESTADDIYVGPYVRVHSRIGNQSAEPSSGKWIDLESNESIVAALRHSNQGGSS
ncbi:phosphoribosyltransferase-like protein [Streptomyces sp. NPDC054950]